MVLEHHESRVLGGLAQDKRHLYADTSGWTNCGHQTFVHISDWTLGPIFETRKLTEECLKQTRSIDSDPNERTNERILLKVVDRFENLSWFTCSNRNKQSTKLRMSSHVRTFRSPASECRSAKSLPSTKTQTRRHFTERLPFESEEKREVK